MGICLICCCMLLTGCSGASRELEDSAVIKALAFDRSDKGYEITAHVIGAEERDLLGVSAETVAGGMMQLNARTERKIFLGKNRVILISSELREIEEILLALYSSQEASMDAKVLIVQGRAKDALSYRGLYGETATDLEKTLENAAENGNFPRVTLYGCVNSMAAERGCCILPMGKLEDENFILERCVVYREGRVLQTLTELQMLGCAILRADDGVFCEVEGNSCALRGISVKNRVENGKNRMEISCKYRLLAGASSAREGVSALIAKSVQEAYTLAGTLRADFLELQHCDLALPLEVNIHAEPEANDYPLKGDFGR